MALINYLGKNLFTINAVGCEPVRFVPGINEITEKELDCIQKHPGFQGKIDDGSIILLSDKKIGTDGKRSVAEMLECIPKILQSKLLKKIIDQDGRDQVIRAAQAQLDFLNMPKSEKSNEVEGVTVS